jgi:hypothetical protein
VSNGNGHINKAFGASQESINGKSLYPEFVTGSVQGVNTISDFIKPIGIVRECYK